MARWSIPPPIPYDWKMRDLSSAKVTVRELEDGRLHRRIEHAPLPGITAEMMLWYLERVDQPMTWRGHTAIGYRFWHPEDHVHFERLGRFGPGDRWHIVEAFARNPRHMVNDVFDVTRLDASGFTMEIRVLGRPVVLMEEWWREAPEGLSWIVDQTIGSTAPVLGPITRFMRKRNAAMLEAWPLHNVQEAGNLPHVLPELYAARAAS